MTLLEFIDENLMRGFIRVYSSDGKAVADIPEGDETGISAVRDYANGEVVKTVQMEGGIAAYVVAKPLPPERGPVVMGYPGELKDEAAFSLDWRARERKASDKQVAFLLKNIRLYLAVRKDSWPEDPSQLLRYEASDAMTEIISIQKRARRGEESE